MFQLLLVIIYIAFISLGLPDSILGSVWPIMYSELFVDISYVGIISMIISLGTIVSSLYSDKLKRLLGTGKVTALSVLMTALALFGFSFSDSFISLCFWAIPYGLGAGSVDASLNNFVALHYASCHMSWLHCMWGIGASLGPYIMGYILTNGLNWHNGYFYISIIQIVLTIFLFISLPLWKKVDKEAIDENVVVKETNNIKFKDIINIKGAKLLFITFFMYCALEQTTGLWASSYLVLNKGIEENIATSLASLFYVGITIGRAISGFITIKLSDKQMVRLGQILILIALIALLLPLDISYTIGGFILIGLGCAPIYPSLLHATPTLFGEDKSHAIIGVEMAIAYVGNLVAPPLFGIVANNISISLLPFYLIFILLIMYISHKLALKLINR